MTLNDFLIKRGERYGEAWLQTSRVIASQPNFYEFMVKAPDYVYAWVVILSKLIRALTSPYDPDHWKDIAGYATLVADDLEKNAPTEADPNVG